MHYKNGREAKVGDLVRGRGYNLKHEFTGVLIDAQPHLESCNFTVVTATSAHIVPERGAPLSPESYLQKEYGALDQLVAIDPETGEELPAT